MCSLKVKNSYEIKFQKTCLCYWMVPAVADDNKKDTCWLALMKVKYYKQVPDKEHWDVKENNSQVSSATHSLILNPHHHWYKSCHKYVSYIYVFCVLKESKNNSSLEIQEKTWYSDEIKFRNLVCITEYSSCCWW